MLFRSMQMAMRMLLSRAKPSRLLIEPTGLGHPMEVLEMLQSAYYRDILDLRSTVTLVDARKISDTRYASHETFNQQIDIADVIVASKADLYGDTETRALRNHLDARGWSGNLVTSANGSLPLDTLSPKSTRGVLAQAQDREHEHDSQPLTELQTPMAEPPLTFPPEGYLRLENRDPAFSSEAGCSGRTSSFGTPRSPHCWEPCMPNASRPWSAPTEATSATTLRATC